MDAASIGLLIACVGLGLVAYRRSREQFRAALRLGWGQALGMLPRIVLAILVSGFLSVLIPTDLVGRSLGGESGLRGVLIASLVGGLLPGGPLISFPIVVILMQAGAGVAQMVALLTAWSVFAFHRLLSYEIPLMGARFAAVRLLSSLALPPLAGLLAAFLAG